MAEEGATRAWLVAGAVNGLLAVAMGAFAAHGLESRLDARALAWVETAARYQMSHGLALLAVAWLAGRPSVRPWPVRLAGWGFLLGCVLFCGLLYLMALSGALWLAAGVPLGGFAFLVGWLGVILAALLGRKTANN